MTGQLLYDKWAGHMLDNGIEVDDWDDLDDMEQDAWKELADYVAERII